MNKIAQINKLQMINNWQERMHNIYITSVFIKAS
jgi:hypothetical protein